MNERLISVKIIHKKIKIKRYTLKTPKKPCPHRQCEMEVEDITNYNYKTKQKNYKT